jgi:hypothetical protein
LVGVEFDGEPRRLAIQGGGRELNGESDTPADYIDGAAHHVGWVRDTGRRDGIPDRIGHLGVESGC